jgi:DnaK suppressor protein
MVDKINVDAFREKILARASELEELSRISADARGAVELDQASVGRVSRIDAIQRQAMALANERSRTAELGRIRAALQRIEEGEYGYCINCGEAIAEKRLNFDPSLATCVDCAS